ncbi:hypothetical protein [Lacisediminihabitans profunda]|uniref:Uncharacterized protein n=1 Tax=Lacisediminihabitans profunda TaxID=2594790 RepID=A0A5C8UUZ3_9MICO|nr:hypothetical protein [Lacisediminihabitans profunda]TXN31436.1 hypothetical protein FVP33_07770 [Lacisediminihabitans profunda]
MTDGPLELPSWRRAPDDRARALAVIDSWAGSAALAELVAAFGGSTAALPDDRLLDYLEAFSAEHWDFRAGRERNLAEQVTLTPEQDALIRARASALGLAGRERPSGRRYDTVLMTGGMVRAGIVKPRFVAELLDRGLEVGHVVFLGGFRAFAGDEIELATALGVRGSDEVAAMVGGMELAFGPLGEPEVQERMTDNPHLSWREYSWSTPGARLSVIAAPSADPSRRANSVDTYRFWARERRAASELSVLLVTTPVYVPYQGAAAVEILGVEHGLGVEAVGVSASASDLGEYSQPFLPRHHLQELRAAVWAMRSLRGRLIAERG